MPRYHSLDDLHLQNTWLTIGVFDGVHRGHQEMLHQLVSGAHKESARAVVLTFHPHPAVVLGGQPDFKCLNTPDERTALLESLGVDYIVTQAFDRLFARQTAEGFMRHVVRNIGLRRLIVGYDTALGRDRQGDARRLAEIGETLGFSVQQIAPLATSDGIISSTHIRAKISSGSVASAASDLGRNYSVTGPVIHGDGRGRSLKIPTANIETPAGKVIPANGVYACWAWLEGRKHRAVTSIGTRPTFNPQELIPHVEAHLLDFNRDLYGQEVRLEFVDWLRGEEKFPSVEELVRQIHADIDRSRAILT